MYLINLRSFIIRGLLPSTVCLFCLLGFNTLNAQQITIKGKVLDNNKAPVFLSTISVSPATDTSRKTNTLTSKNGTFAFKGLSAGKYMLHCTHTAYKDTFIFIYLQHDTTIDITGLSIKADTLQAALVQANKRALSYRKGVLRFDFTDDSRKSSATALDLLRFAPGISINSASGGDDITLFGKGNIMLSVDGKQLFLSKEDAIRYLKNIPPGQIASVEILPNPPAAYALSYSGGVINVILKKSDNVGVKINVASTISQGHSFRDYNSMNITYNIGRFQSAFNYAFTHNNLYYDKSWQYDYRQSAINQLYQHITQYTALDQHYFAYSADWHTTQTSSLGMLVTGNFQHNGINVTTPATYHMASASDSNLVLLQHGSNPINRLVINVHYSNRIDTLGKTLLIDGNYLRNNNTSNTLFTNTWPGNPFAANYVLQAGLSFLTTSYNGRIQLDAPFKHNFAVTLGYQFTENNFDNTGSYDTLQTSGIKPSSLSTSDSYQERIHALYASVSKTYKKWTLNAGIRDEITEADLGSSNHGNSDLRHYNGLTPNISLQWNISRKHSLDFSLSEYLVRPTFSQLAQTPVYVNQNLIYKGNDSLQQFRITTYRIGYSLKGTYFFSIRYDYLHNYIPQYAFLRDPITNITYNTYANIANSKAIQVSAYVPFTFFKIWSSYNTLNFFYTHAYSTNASYEGFAYDNSNVNISSSNYVKVGKTTYITTDIDATTPFRLNQNSIRASYSIDLGVQRTFWKNRLSVGVSLKDIAYSGIRKGESYFNNTVQHFYERSDTRRVGLSISYTFGKTKVPNVKKRDTGNQGVEERLK